MAHKGSESGPYNGTSTPSGVDRAREWLTSRRDLFKLAGLGGATAFLGEGCAQLFPILVVEFGTTLTRPQDLTVLRFEFANLSLDAAMGGGLELKSKAPLGYIIVHFQPQNFLEKALEETSPVPAKPMQVLISGPSRVVLKVPYGAPTIPFTSEGLLAALGSLEMSVAPNAVVPERRLLVSLGGLGSLASASVAAQATPSKDLRAAVQLRNQVAAGRYLSVSSGLDVSAPSGPIAAAVDPNVRPRLPFNGETSLELPFRLILSPNVRGGWAHTTKLAQALKNGRHELWHTRLGVRNSDGVVNEKPSYLRTVRAIWTRDAGFTPQIDPGPPVVPAYPAPDHFTPASIIPSQRIQIVHMTSNFLDLGSYDPKPVDVTNLMLSTLGGWLDSNVDFTVKSPLNVVSWQHKASMGRDYFVKVVEKGRLYPHGHLALKTTITERKFRAPDRTTAYLYQRIFIEVIEPLREYTATWRKSAFRSVLVKTLVTPNLSGIVSGPVSGPIIVGTTPFRFKMEGVDPAGNVIKFTAPATWVPVNNQSVIVADLRGGGGAADLFDAYPVADRTIALDGQRVAWSASKKANDSTYETVSFLLDGTVQGDSIPSGVPFSPPTGIPYLPGVRQNKLNVEAIRHLVGKDAPTDFEFQLAYLQHGMPSAPGPHGNKGELLLQVKGVPVGLNFSAKSDSSGGFMAPSLDIIGLSRKTGPVSGDASSPAKLAESFADVAGNNFDPKKFLKSIDARLFGVIPLADIIAPVLDAAGGLDNAPQFITQTVDAVTGFIDDIARLDEILDRMVSKFGASVQTKVQALKDKLDEVRASIDTLFSSPDLTTAVNNAKAVIDALSGLLSTFISTTVDSLPAGILSAEKQDLKRRAKSIQDVLAAVKAGLTAFATGLELAKNLTVRLEWKAPLQADDAGFFVPLADGGFILAVEVRGKQVGDKPAGVDVIAGIEKFDVNVFGTAAKLVTLPFERLVFKVESNKKPDIDVVFRGNGIGFDGILAFIETLAKLIPGAGFSDPPAIEVSAEGIEASFSIPIPSIAVGVFSIQNMSFGAGFKVPFIGEPLSVNFNFCTREEMFVLTVMMVGGGGFVGLRISPFGMILLEAAFEARAQLAIDLGVASGSISIAVGVYFRLEINAAGDQSGELTGYIRFQGKVSVLGLISASITLLLEMTYEFETQKLKGRATLTIEITIVFFSFSVELSVERKLAGSSSDPTFVEQMQPYVLDGVPVDPWAEYMGSFVLAA